MRTIFVFFFSFTLSFLASAKTESHTLENKKINIDILEGWSSVEGLFAIPLTILGPWENESRPALAVIDAKLSEKQVSQEKFQNLFKELKAEKEKWVKSQNGELKSYDSDTKVTLTNSIKGHYIGSEFIINDILFIERSYYLYCKGNIWNLKWSLRDEHRRYLSVLQKMVESFRCE